MSAIIPCFADAMIERHGPMASAYAMQHAVDCHRAGDEYGESFWLWVSDLTSLAAPGTPGTILDLPLNRSLPPGTNRLN